MTVQAQLRRLCAAMLLALAYAPSVEAAPALTLYTEEYPPYSWYDKAGGRAAGLSVEIVAELLARAHVAATAPIVVPWARGLAQTLAHPHTCLFSTTRTAAREMRYRWIGPIARNEWVMFARRSDHIVLGDLAAARGYDVGVIIDDALNPYLSENHLKLSVTSSHRLNPLKLKAGRIQLWATGRLSGLHLLRDMGIDEFEPVFDLARHDMYLACHRAMDQAEVERLNAVLRAMLRDGTVRRIYTRLGYEKEAPEPQ